MQAEPKRILRFADSIWHMLLDLAYPPKCAACNRLGDRAFCSDCLSECSRNHSGLRRLPAGGPLGWHAAVFHYEGRARQAVVRLKFHRATALARPLSILLSAEAERLGVDGADAIVPVPIHWRRLCQRGFNQSEKLCCEFPQDLVKPNFLTRIRATRPQVGLTIEQRLLNLKGAFTASPEVTGLRILLIDDVLTSGGTAEASASALKAAGAKEVGILVLASERAELEG